MNEPLKYIERREMMVEQQLKQRDITDAQVLAAMRRVPRQLFVPPKLSELAYQDKPLPIGKNQTISQPYIVALMTQLLNLSRTESPRVLEVGTGSGYQTAILCELASHVTSIERHPLLAGRAGDVLAKLGYNNVEIHIGDGSQGLMDMAPFDAILVTAAAPALPEPLRLQMHPDGGHMVIPIGAPDGSQRLELITRQGDQWQMQRLLGVRFVPLVGRFGVPPYTPKDQAAGV